MKFLSVSPFSDIISLVIAFALSAAFTWLLIPFLRKKSFRQYIREEGPSSHQKKSGTPTMGGLAIIAALALSGLIAAWLISGKVESGIWVLIAVTVLFGAIGFLDDYIKVAEKHNLGLRAWQKFMLQVLFGVLLAVYMARFSEQSTTVWIPFVDRYVDFGWFYYPFVVIVVVAAVNSVNLTDGLDGLASGTTAIVALFFALIASDLAQKVPQAFSLALAGVCLGFLTFNHHPAQLFMGDTGSMALGGALAASVIMMKMEMLLVIAGFVFVMETLSVIIQVICFQTTGKRPFRMTPIHHHFELGGMKEQNVVVMFWFAAVLCCILAYIVYRV